MWRQVFAPFVLLELFLELHKTDILDYIYGASAAFVEYVELNWANQMVQERIWSQVNMSPLFKGVTIGTMLHIVLL